MNFHPKYAIIKDMENKNINLEISSRNESSKVLQQIYRTAVKKLEAIQASDLQEVISQLEIDISNA